MPGAAHQRRPGVLLLLMVGAPRDPVKPERRGKGGGWLRAERESAATEMAADQVFHLWAVEDLNL